MRALTSPGRSVWFSAAQQFILSVPSLHHHDGEPWGMSSLMRFFKCLFTRDNINTLRLRPHHPIFLSLTTTFPWLGCSIASFARGHSNASHTRRPSPATGPLPSQSQCNVSPSLWLDGNIIASIGAMGTVPRRVNSCFSLVLSTHSKWNYDSFFSASIIYPPDPRVSSMWGKCTTFQLVTTIVFELTKRKILLGVVYKLRGFWGRRTTAIELPQ